MQYMLTFYTEPQLPAVPATDGPVEFDRINRVHLNTMEPLGRFLHLL